MNTDAFPTLAFYHLTAPIPNALPNGREEAHQQGAVQECRNTWREGLGSQSILREEEKNMTQNETTQRWKRIKWKWTHEFSSLFFHFLTKCSRNISQLLPTWQTNLQNCLHVVKQKKAHWSFSDTLTLGFKTVSEGLNSLRKHQNMASLHPEM